MIQLYPCHITIGETTLRKVLERDINRALIETLIKAVNIRKTLHLCMLHASQLLITDS